MPDQLFKLFDEYAAAYARGERPSAENYLERAGAAREQLASLLDEFLRRTPVPPPSEDDRRSLRLIVADEPPLLALRDRKSTRLNSSHGYISYAVFCLKKKTNISATHTYIVSSSFAMPG